VWGADRRAQLTSRRPARRCRPRGDVAVGFAAASTEYVAGGEGEGVEASRNGRRRGRGGGMLLQHHRRIRAAVAALGQASSWSGFADDARGIRHRAQMRRLGGRTPGMRVRRAAPADGAIRQRHAPGPELRSAPFHEVDGYGADGGEPSPVELGATAQLLAWERCKMLGGPMQARRGTAPPLSPGATVRSDGIRSPDIDAGAARANRGGGWWVRSWAVSFWTSLRTPGLTRARSVVRRRPGRVLR
jgi:hypothetical protein